MDDLSTQELRTPSAAAVDAYEAKAEVLVDQVNRAVVAHPEVGRLLGGTPLEMMYVNHRHHHQFLTAVFRLGSFRLLAETLPWVYRAYHAHGYAYDYFPVELAAWIAAVEEYLQPRDAEELKPAYYWMVELHNEVIRRAEAVETAPRQGAPRFQRVWQRLVQTLAEGDQARAAATVEDELARGVDLRLFYLEVFQPALVEIGRLWERAEISVAQEHLATAIVSRLMARIDRGVHPAEPPCGTAVVTAAPNEYHEVGARMIADFLEMDGWAVRYLGANTPVEALLELLRAAPADLLLVSVCMPFNIDKARQLIERVRAEPDLAGTRIMAGGQAFSIAPELWQQIGADGYEGDARGAAALATRWLGQG